MNSLKKALPTPASHTHHAADLAQLSSILHSISPSDFALDSRHTRGNTTTPPGTGVRLANFPLKNTATHEAKCTKEKFSSSSVGLGWVFFALSNSELAKRNLGFEIPSLKSELDLACATSPDTNTANSSLSKNFKGACLLWPRRSSTLTPGQTGSCTRLSPTPSKTNGSMPRERE